ncbi:MAG TPA: helix-turn-helix domain-containing protein [Alphaproteobacteria bacterium]|nr:helix-turn-helix domain-containing protein [Alphaproteobacteria bacterium]
MNDFNQKLYNLGLQEVIERYLKHYFDLHGDLLPVDGLYFCLKQEIERALIGETLRRLNGNQVQAAKLLGINRNTLRRKILDLHISLEAL